MTAAAAQPAPPLAAPGEVLPAPVPSLRRNFSWTLLGNVVYAGCQWGVLVVLAKLGSAAMVGQYALGLAITAPVVLFSNLQLREVQATDARRQFSFGHYMALRLLCTLGALAVVGGIAASTYLNPRRAAPAADARQTALVVLLVALAKALDSVSDMCFGLLQRREHMKPVAATLAANGVVTLVAMTAALVATRSVVWAAAGSVLGSAAATVVAWLLTARLAGAAALRPAWDWQPLGRLAWLALPLGFVALLISLNTNMPRYFVEHHLGEAQLGIFAAMAYVMIAGTTVVAALSQSASSRLAQLFSARDLAAFRRLLFKLVGIGAALGLAGLLVAASAGGPVLALLYRREYAAASGAFTWMMAAGLVAYAATFLNTAMVAVREIRAQTPLFLAVAACGFAGCAVLVPRYGLSGGAIAALLAYLVQFAGAAGIVAARLRRAAATPAET